jgi:hypothetical protein
MQNATEASRPIPSPVTATALHESFKRSLEILEDSPTEGLTAFLHIISGAATEEELFSDYKLFEGSLHQLLSHETATTILTFLHDQIVTKNHSRKLTDEIGE